MSETDNTTRNIGIAVIILLLLTSGLFLILNSKNKKNLNAEKLRTETLLSEKLNVEKDLAGTKADLKSCQLQSEELNKKLAEAEAKIAEKDKRIASLSGQSATLAKLRKEMEALQKEKADIEAALAAVKDDLAKANALAVSLKNSIAKLEEEKADLSKKLADALLYNTDNFRIYGSRGKTTEKLTFWAFRTKKLNISFDVPQSLTDAISFKITTPAGTTVTPETAGLSWKIIDNPRNYTASLSPVTGEFEPSRQVALTYAPKEKMAKGEYKILVFANEINIGSCRVKLK